MKVPRLAEMIENVRVSYSFLFASVADYKPSGFHLRAVKALVLREPKTMRLSGWTLHGFCTEATRDPIPVYTEDVRTTPPLFLYLIQRYTLEYGEPQDDGEGETWLSRASILSILDEELKNLR